MAEPALKLVEIDWPQWIDSDDAAERLGRSADHFRRQCRTMLAAGGMARKMTPPQGGKARWFVLRDFDDRLANGAIARPDVPDLKHFSQKQRDQALARADAVKLYREARRTRSGPERDWIDVVVAQIRRRHPDLKVSAKSLQRWHGLLNCNADIVKLIDKRGGNQAGEADPAFWQKLAEYYLDERQPSLRSCWARAKEWADCNGVTPCSYKQAQRKLDRHIPPATQALYRTPRDYRQRFAPFIEQNVDAWQAGQRWVGDHAQLDFWVRFNGSVIRPWITIWQDWRTRRIVGYVLSAKPNSTTILSAFRVAMLDEANKGGPAEVAIDNGKDFDCYMWHGQTKQQRKLQHRLKLAVDETRTEGIFNWMRIDARFSIPHNPNGKSRCERWFETLHEQFDKTMPSYCGRNSDHRPEYINRMLARERHRLPTFAHVQDRIDDFIRGYNASDNHRMVDLEGLSPDEAMAQWNTTRRAMADPASLDLILAHWHKPLRVGRNGVTLNLRGKAVSYGQFEPALTPFKRKHKKGAPLVHVRYDPADIRSVQVYDSDGRFVCTASMNKLGGGSSAISSICSAN